MMQKNKAIKNTTIVEKKIILVKIGLNFKETCVNLANFYTRN